MPLAAVVGAGPAGADDTPAEVGHACTRDSARAMPPTAVHHSSTGWRMATRAAPRREANRCTSAALEECSGFISAMPTLKSPREDQHGMRPRRHAAAGTWSSTGGAGADLVLPRVARPPRESSVELMTRPARDSAGVALDGVGTLVRCSSVGWAGPRNHKSWTWLSGSASPYSVGCAKAPRNPAPTDTRSSSLWAGYGTSCRHTAAPSR